MLLDVQMKMYNKLHYVFNTTAVYLRNRKSLQSVQPLQHSGHVMLQPQQSCGYLLIDVSPGSTATLRCTTACSSYTGTPLRAEGRTR